MVGLGLPMAGHSSSTVPLLSPMIVVFLGLIITGGAEKVEKDNTIHAVKWNAAFTDKL